MNLIPKTLYKAKRKIIDADVSPQIIAVLQKGIGENKVIVNEKEVFAVCAQAYMIRILGEEIVIYDGKDLQFFTFDGTCTQHVTVGRHVLDLITMKGRDEMQRCQCKELKQLKVEADIGADPLWCNDCHSNLEVEEFPLPEALKEELFVCVDWETDGIVPNGVILEQQHNERGAELAKKVKQVLEGQYEVVFSPSTFAKKYSNVKF